MIFTGQVEGGRLSAAAGWLVAMTVREHMILRLAAATYRYPARREADALELVGLTPTRFWAAVDRLLDDPDALAAYPTVVRRLRRLRDARARQRSARRLSA